MNYQLSTFIPLYRLVLGSCDIPAVICSLLLRAKIRKSGGAPGGRAIATGRLVLGYIALVLGIMGIALLVSIIQSDRERVQRLSTERKQVAPDDGK